MEELIGQTPLLRLDKLFRDRDAEVFAKLEMLNPMSIKDRSVLSMIRGAIAAGRIDSDTEVVEASSGNTAIAIASLSVVLGFRVRIYMSELASVERRQILCAFGAKVIVTPSVEHTKGARSRAIEYCNANPETTFFLNQHGNPDNAKGHYTTTAPELWKQMEGRIDAIVVGLGTSGTFEGTATYLKERDPRIQIIGFEPASSPVYSGGAQGKHRLIGIGPGFVTENFLRARHLLDEIILVGDDVAYEWTQKIARVEGLLCGPTSGAATWVADQLVQRKVFHGKRIACFFYDTGERYLSSRELFPADNVEMVP